VIVIGGGFNLLRYQNGFVLSNKTQTNQHPRRKNKKQCEKKRKKRTQDKKGKSQMISFLLTTETTRLAAFVLSKFLIYKFSLKL
jgi:hypothetical protein